jgi:hypothetical protein
MASVISKVLATLESIKRTSVTKSHMKTKPKTTSYIVHSIAAAAMLLTAQISLAGSATWLFQPQDSAWENPNNWSPGGPPNGPSDVATFAASNRSNLDISTPVEVAGIVFTLNQDFGIFVLNSELTFSGIGVTNNSGTYQSFFAGDAGQIIFNNTSTAGDATILGGRQGSIGGKIIFNDSSTAGSAALFAESSNSGNSGIILFNGASTGGTASVAISPGNSGPVPGLLDISGHQSGVTVGSIEGAGDVYLGANDLTVGTNNFGTNFYGVIENFGQGGSLAKIGSGILTLQNNTCFKDTVGLILVSGSIINLDFGPTDVIASLKVNGVPQPQGIYGGPMSGAPHVLPELEGSGTVHVRSSKLTNISTRAFVQTGDNVMIGGFIVQGQRNETVIIRAIGPELTQYGVPNPLANPTLELHDATGALIASNDNWMTTIIGGIIFGDQVQDIRDSGYAPTDPTESAIIATLPSGNYTAIVRGVSNTTGVALAEVYDLHDGSHNTSVLSNISTRSFVQRGDNVMIGGFIVEGSGRKRVIARAVGPGLTQYGVPNPLADPTLELHDSTGALIASNDNWQHTIIGGIIINDQVAAIRASGHAPGDPRESAIIANLPPGNYTAIVRGVNATTGVALVEVYDLD